MELRDAIERVEGGDPANSPQCTCFELDVYCPNCETYAEALALVLAAAKRPGFTREDAEALMESGAYYASRYPNEDSSLLLSTTLLAKLDAYLEGLKGQSE